MDVYIPSVLQFQGNVNCYFDSQLCACLHCNFNSVLTPNFVDVYTATVPSSFSRQHKFPFHPPLSWCLPHNTCSTFQLQVNFEFSFCPQWAKIKNSHSHYIINNSNYVDDLSFISRKPTLLYNIQITV